MRLNPKKSGEFIANEAQYVQVQEIGVKHLAKQVLLFFKHFNKFISNPHAFLLHRFLTASLMEHLTLIISLNTSFIQNQLTLMLSTGFSF